MKRLNFKKERVPRTGPATLAVLKGSQRQFKYCCTVSEAGVVLTLIILKLQARRSIYTHIYPFFLHVPCNKGPGRLKKRREQAPRNS